MRHVAPGFAWLLAAWLGTAAATGLKEDVLPYDGGRLVVASGGRDACVVAIQGLITRETTRLFDDALGRAESLGCASPWILLESPGGLSDDGLRVGREIRARRLRTITRGECASACGIIFLGGVERVLAGPGARIGFHQPATQRTSGQRWCSSTADSNSVREIRRYLRFMVPTTADRLMREIMDTSCDAIVWAQGPGALDLGVATRVESAAAGR